MITAINIQNEISDKKPLLGRTKHTPESEEAAAFAELSKFDKGGIYAGSFSGETAWERHPVGDELVQVLSGSVILTILTETEEERFELSSGMLIVVPKGLWHRFQVPELVTLLTATQLPTEISTAEDPRAE